LKKLDAWADKKVDEERLKPMAENFTRKSDTKVDKKSEGLFKKEKSTKKSNQFLLTKMF